MTASVNVARLIERLRNDRFETDPGSRGETDLAYRRGWNAAVGHVETVIVPFLLAEQKVTDGLDELRDTSPLDMVQRIAIKKTLETHDGNIARTAKQLGVKRQSLQRMMTRLGLRKRAVTE